MVYSAEIPLNIDLGGISGDKRRVSATTRSVPKDPIRAVLVPVVHTGQHYEAAGPLEQIVRTVAFTPDAADQYDLDVPLEAWQGPRSVLLLFVRETPPDDEPNFPLIFEFKLSALRVGGDLEAAVRPTAEAKKREIIEAIRKVLHEKRSQLGRGVMGPP